MNAASRYFEYAQGKLSKVLESEMQNIQNAAGLIADSCKKGGKFYIFGSGHSHMIAEELYLRTGGLALVHAMLPPELMLHQMSMKSSLMERLEGYGKALVDLYHIDEKDTVMVVSNSGRNAVPVEVCYYAKVKGAKVIALTSMKHSAGCASRHSSNKKIYELADVIIDNFADKGDAGFKVEGMENLMGPVSSVTGVVIAEALACQVAENLTKDGIVPPVFISSNVDGGDEYNDNLFKTYYGYWK